MFSWLTNPVITVSVLGGDGGKGKVVWPGDTWPGVSAGLFVV